jgi:hypothetical protein
MRIILVVIVAGYIGYLVIASAYAVEEVRAFGKNYSHQLDVAGHALDEPQP